MKSSLCLLGLASLCSTVLAGDRWTQCGGKLWKGDTTCSTEGWTCQVQNPYYSQCLPADEEDTCDSDNETSEPESTNTTPTSPSSSSAAPATSSAAGIEVANPGPKDKTAKSGNTSSGSSNNQSSGSTVKPNTGGKCAAYSGDKTNMATTTHYFDGQKGACGCGTGESMSSWQDNPATKVYTAAGSQNLFGGSGSWCGSGCGTCYELTNMGAIAGAGQGECTGAGDKITVMITNLCPANGNEEWCSVPNRYTFGAHFDIMSKDGPEGWNNPVVSYKEVACPGSLTSDWKTCSCASGKQSRARRGLMTNTF